MRITRRTWLVASAVSIGNLIGGALSAQSPRKPIKIARLPDDGFVKVGETEVSLELIATATAATEHAQAWGQRLQKLDIQFQTRQAIAGDKAEVKEKQLGRLRRVTVVAVLDRNGKIVCHDRAFTLAEADKLAEWIRELKTYGAQGAPQGKPLFGLDDRQFVGVMRELSVSVEIDTEGLSLEAALAKLPLPEKHPLRMTPEAQRAARNLDADKKLRTDARGLSVGTALAATLGEFGLSFKPLRTPEGKIELSVSPREAGQDAWPIGWPLDPEKPQGQLVPALFKTVPVALEDVPLTDVLTAASQASEVPLLIDHYAIERAEIDLSELKVTVPNRKTTWGLLLRQVTFPHKLGRRIVADDAGKSFVLITTLKETLNENPAAKSK
ncbi:MAG: hypothetical protein DWI21_18100 [Planctomycetota bacterium]|nr:MAG: hypothetical protein DWI21_18100 [Planctomycetota bacterium]